MPQTVGRPQQTPRAPNIITRMGQQPRAPNIITRTGHKLGIPNIITRTAPHGFRPVPRQRIQVVDRSRGQQSTFHGPRPLNRLPHVAGNVGSGHTSASVAQILNAGPVQQAQAPLPQSIKEQLPSSLKHLEEIPKVDSPMQNIGVTHDQQPIHGDPNKVPQSSQIDHTPLLNAHSGSQVNTDHIPGIVTSVTQHVPFNHGPVVNAPTQPLLQNHNVSQPAVVSNVMHGVQTHHTQVVKHLPVHQSPTHHTSHVSQVQTVNTQAQVPISHVSHVQTVNTQAQVPISHVSHIQTVNTQTQGASSVAQTQHLAPQLSQPIGHVSHAQTINTQGPNSPTVTQHVTLTHNRAPGLPSTPIEVTKLSSGHDPLFEELVNEFTKALSDPARYLQTHGSPTAAHPVSPHVTHAQTAFSPSHAQPPLHQFPGAYPGMMHSPFGINPWMLDPVAREEMLFGDTTDPPVPPTEPATTTVVPETTTIAAPMVPVSAGKVPTLLTGGKLSVVKPSTGEVPTVSNIAVEALVTVPTSGPTPIIDLSTVTTSVAHTTTVATHGNLATITSAKKSLATKSPKPIVNVEAVPSTVKSVQEPQSNVTGVKNDNSSTSNKTVNVDPRALAEITGMLSNTKIDLKTITAAIQLAASQMGGLPPDIRHMAEMLGINVDKLIQPHTTASPVRHETIPSIEQLGIQYPDQVSGKGNRATKDTIAILKGSTRGVVVYPPTTLATNVGTLLELVTHAPLNKTADILQTLNKATETLHAKVDQSHGKAETTTVDHLNIRSPHAQTDNISNSVNLTVGVEIPTLPPAAGATQPDVYHTLKTILDHNPKAIVKAISKDASSNTATQGSVGSAVKGHSVAEGRHTHKANKLVVQSLVDIEPNGHLPNLQAMLTDISQTHASSANATTVVKPTSSVVTTSASGLGTIYTHANETIASNIKIEPIDFTQLSYSNMEGVPVKVEQILEPGSPTENIRTPQAGIPVKTTDLTSVLNEVLHHANHSGIDATGVMSILNEITDMQKSVSFSANGANNSEGALIAEKLSDPVFVQQLKHTLLKMIKQTATTAGPRVVTTGVTTDVITTTSMPPTSTEEFELEEMVTVEATPPPS